jgi:hypothetical protein
MGECMELMEEVVGVLSSILPEHKGELSITHNRHKSNYETVEECLSWGEGVSDDEFATPTTKQKMIDTNEMWECQWYPDTPVGFCRVFASTLEELLNFFNDDFERTIQNAKGK